jgi:spore maturation protein CgeB
VKVLFVGQPYSEKSVWSRIQIKALQESGCQVTVFDERLSHLPGLRWLPHRISRRLKQRLPALAAKDTVAMNRMLLATVRRIGPHLLLASKGMHVYPDSIQRIGRAGVITANWFPDDIQHLEWLRSALKVYSHVFSFDSYTTSLFRGEGATNVHYLPLGCDPQLHRSVPLSQQERVQYACDVAFVGALYPERLEALRVLKDLDCKIWGYSEWQQTDLAGLYQGPIDNGEPLAKLYSACRIALNIHFASPAHGANYRTFEIAGCGACQVVSSRADIPALFEPGKEIVIYKDLAELRERVDSCLSDDRKRAAVAEAGQVRAHREHTVRQRMEQILDTVRH